MIRGNVIAIPIGQTLLYVEPIYLQADTAAYPELRLVVLMHGDDLSYAETFEAALEGLFEDAATPWLRPLTASPQPLWQNGPAVPTRFFESYLRLQGEGRFREAGGELERLQVLLQRLAEPADGDGGTLAVLDR